MAQQSGEYPHPLIAFIPRHHPNILCVFTPVCITMLIYFNLRNQRTYLNQNSSYPCLYPSLSHVRVHTLILAIWLGLLAWQQLLWVNYLFLSGKQTDILQAKHAFLLFTTGKHANINSISNFSCEKVGQIVNDYVTNAKKLSNCCWWSIEESCGLKIQQEQPILLNAPLMQEKCHAPYQPSSPVNLDEEWSMPHTYPFCIPAYILTQEMQLHWTSKTFYHIKYCCHFMPAITAIWPPL